MSSLQAPMFPGCSLNGTNTGTCCAIFPVTSYNGITTCQTSASRVDDLQSCLKALGTTPKNGLACNDGSSNFEAKPSFTPASAANLHPKLALSLALAAVAIVVVTHA